MNTLSAKACFLKLKIDTLFASNLFKTATSFLHSQAKLKNLFSLLLKLKFKFKFNVSIILQVESAGLICVSVNPIMPLFIILLSLTTYLHVLEVILH